MKTRSYLAVSLVLILAGGWLLAVEFYPSLKGIVYSESSWPLNIIGIGLLMALVGLVTWTPVMMIPASVIGGVGGLLYWQNATGNWDSWAYAWALIPGFAGVGIFLSGLLKRDRGGLLAGSWMVVYSLVILGIFGSFLGGGDMLSRYWPVGLILLGLLMLAQGVVRSRRAN